MPYREEANPKDYEMIKTPLAFYYLALALFYITVFALYFALIVSTSIIHFPIKLLIGLAKSIERKEDFRINVERQHIFFQDRLGIQSINMAGLYMVFSSIGMAMWLGLITVWIIA